MNQYDPTFDLKINVGHGDLYSMVQWFCLISWRLFDVWTILFGPFTQTYINKIEMVQRRAVRWVNSNYSTYASVSSMLDSLGWRSLEDRRADARLVLFYKIVYNLVAVPLPQYINHPVRMTRYMHPLHFVQIPATASYYKYSLFPLAIVQWNRLPHHIPVLSDLDSFRSAVRTVSHLMP